MDQETENPVTIPLDGAELEGELHAPDGATGLVVFAHGSESGRKSPRNAFVAEVIRSRGLGTLLFDLLTESEDRTYQTRFDIELLTDRLLGAAEWVRGRDDTGARSLGYFGSSTGATAALRATATDGDQVRAVVPAAAAWTSRPTDWPRCPPRRCSSSSVPIRRCSN